ncbi:DHH family phosphoesterase [Candidatus Halobonum tyrrellensis]|uniref:Exopolyphosphatase n=1 Tax=Candidatus Halobonum tyrrellensis G22 TaxID=1324957 RepID=V4HFL0_9EURY|nr:DHHA1 domain-containing protein [Candidatus Halobonum tyrrellensis]ESP88863.1 exopolyphosphatase [Candidatus Halobonum tyrrellensis G22]
MLQPDGAQFIQWMDDAVALDPRLLVGVAGGTLALVAAVFLLRRLRRTPGERLTRLLADYESVAVLLHPNPDADAMATAIGVADLAEGVDTDTTLQFTGQVRRQENRAFRTVLDVDIERIDHVSDLAAEAVVLVDHNEPRGFAGADGVLPVAVVDHHPGGGSGERFTDVRTDYGACASVITEYFREVGATPVPPDRHDSEVAGRALPTRVATGLLYGILSDTNRLTRGASAADFEAASYLHEGVDEDLLTRIAEPEMSTETLEVKARAIAGRDIRGSFCVSDVGDVSSVDAIPQAADELVGLEGVTAVVVVGEKDGTLHLSGRSRDDRVHMGRTLEAAVDDVPNASAGGHARMGGGQLPPVLQTDGTREVTAPRGDALVDRLFDAMTGEV